MRGRKEAAETGLFRHTQVLVDIVPQAAGLLTSAHSDEIVRDSHPLPIFTPGKPFRGHRLFPYKKNFLDDIIAHTAKNCKRIPYWVAAVSH